MSFKIILQKIKPAYPLYQKDNLLLNIKNENFEENEKQEYLAIQLAYRVRKRKRLRD